MIEAEDVGEQWRANVAQYLGEGDLLQLSTLRLDDEETIGCGFKNFSCVTKLSRDGKDETQPCFVKIGESRQDALFHQHSTSLRRLVGLESVPVAVVEGIHPALSEEMKGKIVQVMERGQRQQVKKKTKKE